MQRNTGYFPTESLEPSGNRLFSRSALNEGDLFRGSLDEERFYYYADVHSHNIMPAFFSEQDNRDELATRLYIVVGRLQRPSPEIRARISNGGKFLEIPLEDVVEVSQAEFPEYWTASVAPWFTANRKGNAL